MLIFSAGGLFQKDYWKFGVIDFPKYQPSVVASETWSSIARRVNFWFSWASWPYFYPLAHSNSTSPYSISKNKTHNLPSSIPNSIASLTPPQYPHCFYAAPYSWPPAPSSSAAIQSPSVTPYSSQSSKSIFHFCRWNCQSFRPRSRSYFRWIRRLFVGWWRLVASQVIRLRRFSL